MAISLGLKEPISLWAMVGGLLAGTIIYILTKKTNFKNTSIVIMWIAISALFDAGIQYLNISNSENIQTILLWLTGSVWGRYWNEVKVLTPYVVIFIPLSGLIGAILLITADIIGRTIIAPSEIPVGIVTAIIGAPYFLYLLLRKKSN